LLEENNMKINEEKLEKVKKYYENMMKTRAMDDNYNGHEYFTRPYNKFMNSIEKE
jgi:hypothetical protein